MSIDLTRTFTAPTAKRQWRMRRSRAFARAFAPPPDLTLDEWADAYRYLSRENSAEPGRWSTDRTPYLREIMRAISDPDVEEVVVKKSARVGYTEGVIGNAIGYFIDRDPSPMLVVQPTVEDAEGWSKDNLTPLIEETPCLKGKVIDQAAKKTGNTILAKRFSGGSSLKTIGANSPRGFRRHTARVVFFDEVDGYPTKGAGTEGDQIALGRKRTQTYDNRKIILGSTPTIKGASRIDSAYEASTKARFFVPCPHCKHRQVLEWKNLHWDKTTLDNGEVVHQPETAHYLCAKCACIIEERHKPKMVHAGEWIEEHPGRHVRGFHVNSLVSLFYGARWETLVREFLDADTPEKLQVWINTVLGEVWEERGEQADPASLAARCEEYPSDAEGNTLLPAEVGLLTMALDVQGDRLEYVVKGWGVRMESWLIEYGVLLGDPGQDDVWEEAGVLLRKTYRHAGGGIMKIRATAVDTGGHHSDRASRFARKWQNRSVRAIKGASEAKQPIWPEKPSKRNKHGVKLYMVGTDSAKDVVFSRLRRTIPGPTYMHFPEGTSDEYFFQLTAEKKVPKVLPGGRRVYIYKQTRERNEALDLEVYNLAVLYSLGRTVYEHLDHWVRRAQHAPPLPLPDAPDHPDDDGPEPDPVVNEPPQRPRPPAPPPRRRGFVHRWR
jgi:phage terminase large subunit GpA-like protein